MGAPMNPFDMTTRNAPVSALWRTRDPRLVIRTEDDGNCCDFCTSDGGASDGPHNIVWRGERVFSLCERCLPGLVLLLQDLQRAIGR